MITAANWKIENGMLVILCTDGQGWWHPIKVSITGEHGQTCIVRQEARVDEDWSHEQGDEREIADYGIWLSQGDFSVRYADPGKPRRGQVHISSPESADNAA